MTTQERFPIDYEEREALITSKLPEKRDLSDHVDFHPKKRLSWLCPPSILIPFAIVGALSTLMMSYSAAKMLWTRNGTPTYTNCGNSTADVARAAGCVYEPMLRAWIPPECSYHDIQDDYDVFRDRKWYADEDFTVLSNTSRLESGDEALAYTRFWHDEHCTYIFRKIAVAVDSKYPAVPEIMASIDHQHHCAHMVVARIRHSYNESYVHNDLTYTESFLNFQTCKPLNWI